MDDVDPGDFTIADCALLEDYSHTRNGVCAPGFMNNDYVRVTQLYCDGVGKQCKDYTQSENNVEFDICSLWCSKPVSVLHEYCDTIKVYVFWPLLFQRQQNSVVSRLHPCVETSNSRASEITLKKLQHLELMEDIVDLAKKVVNDSFFIGGLLRIGYKIENKILAMEEALNWVKYTGDLTILPKLGALDNGWPMLSIFFTEYKYHITKVVTENCNLLDEYKTKNCAECIEQGELMKMKGNEEFSKERFDIAIIYYTRAIEYRPENHLLYGNRALCFLRTGQLRNALGDGKRATILKNSWPKGHYRYCDALSLLGEYDWALQANIKAQRLCKNDPEGIRDLIHQHVKLQKLIEDLQGRTSCRSQIKKACCDGRTYIPRTGSTPAFTTSLNFVEKDSTKTTHEMASGGNPNSKVVNDASKEDDCDCPEFRAPSGPPPRHKGRHRSRNNDLEKLRSSSQANFSIDLKTILDKQLLSKSSRAAHQDFSNIMKMLRGLIQDGYTALLEQRCRSAAQAFTELLNSLDPQKIKQLSLAMINYVLVVYGLAISLLGIGQPEELSEAENQFKRIIEFYPNEGLDCLAYCGIGEVYLKKNRYADALTHFEKAKTLIGRLPGVLTWPTSNVVIEETRPGKIKTVLDKFIEECKFPPVPDAVCSYQKCNGYSKIQIYTSDPDFKGFIRISCCQCCKIEFHMNCWKKLKASMFDDKIDKDFLQGVCLTPDCKGVISKIIIFNSCGRVKCEFEHKVIKEKVPPRPILKQKCSSLEKQQLKEDKRVKRKIQKIEAKRLARERLEEDLREKNPPKVEERKETVGYAQSCQFVNDRILQCLKQYSEKIKSGVLNSTKLLQELLSWKVLTPEDYTTCFSSRNFVNEAVDFVIGLLVQENNKVKTRIFLHVLSEFQEMDPKLATWIQKLNSFGLDATGTFLSRCGESLKELDFSILTFLWNEKYGNKLESLEGKNMDYLFEPTSVKSARCFIWLLEEHREKFPALQSALDEFFDILDSRCTVLRKQDCSDVPFTSTKVKNKGKKKKQKDTKPMLVGSGTPSVTTNTESVNSGEDHKRSSSAAGPFVVPEHLREEVKEFEALYEQQQNPEYVIHNKRVWDINPKQKNSTLYDYFSQFLEEHGPLDMGSRIFSEEYEFFPEETRRILEKAGGLKSFLLGCPRFVVIDNCIALRKVALRLKKKRKKRNMKAKVEELSKALEMELFLQLRLSLSLATMEFEPDAEGQVESDLSSAPASEDLQPRSEAEDPPEPAVEDVEPEPEPEGSCGPVSDDGNTEVVPPAAPEKADDEQIAPPPTPVPEEVKPTHVSAHFSKPVSGEVEPVYWPQSHLVTGYCTYLPFQGFDITQTPPAFIGMLPSLPQYANIYTPLAALCPEYQLRAAVPVVPTFVASNRPDENAAAYAEGHCLDAEDAPGSRIASEPEVSQDAVESPCSPDAGVTALHEAPGEGHCGKSAEQKEDAESDGAASHVPRTQTVAVQVCWNVTHQEVNTEPYEPFEAEQGEIAQIEKEDQVLRKQLKEACENYEKIKLKSSEEIQDLEEKLKRNAEESKISKTELGWFLKDLEKEVKKWQQERKEIQERLKALMKKIVRLSSANNAFNTLANETEEEKKAHYADSLERARVAEMTVLANWKEKEVCKLQVMEAQAEGCLMSLKLASDSAGYSEMEPDINAWESFLSKVRTGIETTEAEFEEQIRAVQNGSRLRDLCEVQIPKLSFPPHRVVRLQFLPEYADTDGQSPVISTSNVTGSQAPVQEDSSPRSASDCPAAACDCPAAARDCPAAASDCPAAARDCPAAARDCPAAASDCPAAARDCPAAASDCPAAASDCPAAVRDCPAAARDCPAAARDCPAAARDCPVAASDCPAEAPSAPLPASPSSQPEVPPPPESVRVPSPAAPPKEGLTAGQKLPLGRARSTQAARKPFNSIIEHLSMVFPCYDSTELAGFIKKVRNKNKNSLSGLSVDEIVQKVTEHILDEQSKRKPSPGKDRKTPEPSPPAGCTQGRRSVAAGLPPEAKEQKAGNGSASGANSCETCHKVLKSKNIRVLKCGHKFHKGCFKQRLKGQRACPACGARDRASEA
ncbi:E3 ubiquitin-protein ligase TTC3 isoform X2 [Tamandua tetradactyla]|uniref:E3 ubiquitin-protein ligase TTC3 isoform X2 n=1 Tax=Tamandua tetradactyla TaxID=48850 RepID=UPI004053CE9C